MSDAHVHIRYTIHMQPVAWWEWLLGLSSRLQIVGVGSSIKDGELLIKTEDGAFYSINYARVRFMRAEPDTH